MEEILSFLRTDTFLWIILASILILLILYISSVIKLSKIKKDYTSFMKKLGNGADLDVMLKRYINEVEEVANKNEEIVSYCKRLDNDIAKCTQKIGLVRYNAFRDTGSDLSFTLALLNENNDGVVLNGIYSRDTSNIYAKPIKNGQSQYTLSEEEKQAIEKAVNNVE